MRKHWKQRAKIFWLRDGDINTRFFHQATSARRKANKITLLKNSDDEWIVSQNEINEVVADYFSVLFMGGTNNMVIQDPLAYIQQVVSADDNAALTISITRDEF